MQQIYIARDRFGVKPLFYYHKNNIITFSTEIKPILNLVKGVEINFNEVADYISSGKYFHKIKSFFKDIKIFPASFFKVINLKKNKVIKFKKYWELKKLKN